MISLCQATKIWSELSAAEPQKSNLKRDVAIGSDRVAVDLEQLNNMPDALLNSTRAIELQEEIAAADPKNFQYASELGLFYVHLGSIQHKLKNSSVARQNVVKGLKMMQQFSDSGPKELDLKRDLALSYQTAGDVFLSSGQSDTALEYFRRSAELIETTPLKNELRENLAENLKSISEILKKSRF